MTKDELSAYYRHLDNIAILRNSIIAEREKGRAEGRAEGKAEGNRLKATKVVRYLKSSGADMELIMGANGLTR